MFHPDTHYSSFEGVVDVSVGNFVGVLEEVRVSECEDAC